MRPKAPAIESGGVVGEQDQRGKGVLLQSEPALLAG